MKYFIVLLVVVASVSARAVTEEQKVKAHEHAATCIKETGVSADDVEKLKKHDFSNKDEKIQCFSKCFLEKIGFLNDKGEFQESVAIEKLSKGESDKTKIEALVNTCKNSKGANTCETAFKLYECYSNHKAL